MRAHRPFDVRLVCVTHSVTLCWLNFTDPLHVRSCSFLVRSAVPLLTRIGSLTWENELSIISSDTKWLCVTVQSHFLPFMNLHMRTDLVHFPLKDNSASWVCAHYTWKVIVYRLPPRVPWFNSLHMRQCSVGIWRIDGPRSTPCLRN